jgi:DNA-binding GntR family transcriptional regulator
MTCSSSGRGSRSSGPRVRATCPNNWREVTEDQNPPLFMDRLPVPARATRLGSRARVRPACACTPRKSDVGLDRESPPLQAGPPIGAVASIISGSGGRLHYRHQRRDPPAFFWASIRLKLSDTTLDTCCSHIVYRVQNTHTIPSEDTIFGDGGGERKARLPVEWPQFRQPTTLTESVYRAVLQRLQEGWQKPGEFIREADLAAAMSVSRTPVREALGRLASEGWVERVPHRGFRVPERSLDDLFHLYPVVQTLEVLAGELAFPVLGESELAEMEAANTAFADALERNAIVDAVQLNDRFHAVLSDHCGNPVLKELLDYLRGQIRRLELMDFQGVLADVGGETHRRWVRQHQEVIERVREGAFDEAQRLIYQNRSIVYLRPEESDAGGGVGEAVSRQREPS